MAGVSNYLKDLILNLLFRDGSFTQPGTLYVALNTTLPNDAGTGGVEVSVGNYARVGVPTTAGAWDAPAAGTGTERRIQNTGVVDFGTASGDWAPPGTEVVGFSLWDAASGGNFWGANSFPAEIIIQDTNPVRFLAGQLDVVLAGGGT